MVGEEGEMSETNRRTGRISSRDCLGRPEILRLIDVLKGTAPGASPYPKEWLGAMADRDRIEILRAVKAGFGAGS